MTSKQRKSLKALAVFLAFSFAQVYVQIGFAVPGASPPIPIPQQFVARLSTRGNAPVTVNGASASGGATILSGATIETPDQVGATVNLGPLGTLDIAPNTKLTIDFDSNGNVHVKVLQGCVILKTKKGTGEVEGPAGSAGKNKGSGVLDACFPVGAAPQVGTGAAAGAGAGAGAGAAAGGAAAGGGLFGLGVPATVAIIGGAGAVTGLAIYGTRGSNPSP